MSDDNQNKNAKDLMNALNSQDGNVDSVLSSLNGIDTSMLNITDSHLQEASNMITNTLGLQNSGMSNLIQDMVGDIGKSVQNGVSISDMINNLSKDFGTKLNDNINNGTISKEDVESTTQNMFSNLQGMTQNPAELMKTIQGAMNGTSAETPESKEAAKQARREALKRKWRNQQKARGKK